MDIKCCNISLIYSNDNVDIMLTDIETGRRALFYSNVIPYDILMMSFKNLLVSCVNDICAIPCTFIFVGDWQYEQDVVLLNMDNQFVANFVKCKMYACYMKYVSDNDLGVRFFDNCTNVEVVVSNACDDYNNDTRAFVNQVRSSGYRGFNKNGDDYIIIGGHLSHYDKTIGITCDDDLLVGTIDAIYSMMMYNILHQ